MRFQQLRRTVSGGQEKIKSRYARGTQLFTCCMSTNVCVKTRYDMEESMESLHEGANIILCVWTYFRRGLSPVDAEWNNKRQFRFISDRALRLMVALCKTSEGDSKTQSHSPSLSLHGPYSNQDCS